MSIAQSLLPEFEHEMMSTRTLLARVPDSKGDYKPHPKSFSLGQLAVHIAGTPLWQKVTMETTEFDLNPPEGARFQMPAFENTAALLAFFDANAPQAHAALESATDTAWMTPWTLKNAGTTVFTMPRIAVYRSMVMNHLIHHRGQLTVYLRLLDVPLPATYGPSADAGM